MLASEIRPVMTFIMIEVVGSILFLIIILSLCIYYKRFYSWKSLNGCTVLITNGDTDLSIELAKQFSTAHNCLVILLKHSIHSSENIQQKSSQILTFDCDLSNSDQLKQFSHEISKHIQTIDIIIDNKEENRDSLKNNSDSYSAESFINATSKNICTTLNILRFFTIKMTFSRIRHFVTIQSPKINFKPFLQSQKEINELFNHLTGFNQSINLTTVLYSKSKNSDFSLAKNSANIVDGIRCNRSLIHINSKRKSLIDFIFMCIPQFK